MMAKLALNAVLVVLVANLICDAHGAGEASFRAQDSFALYAAVVDCDELAAGGYVRRALSVIVSLPVFTDPFRHRIMFAKRFNNISAVDGTGIECKVGECQSELVPWPLTTIETLAPPDWFGVYYSKNLSDSGGAVECNLFMDGLAVLWSDAECPPFIGSGWLPPRSPFLVRVDCNLDGSESIVTQCSGDSVCSNCLGGASVNTDVCVGLGDSVQYKCPRSLVASAESPSSNLSTECSSLCDTMAHERCVYANCVCELGFVRSSSGLCEEMPSDVPSTDSRSRTGVAVYAIPVAVAAVCIALLFCVAMAVYWLKRRARRAPRASNMHQSSKSASRRFSSTSTLVREDSRRADLRSRPSSAVHGALARTLGSNTGSRSTSGGSGSAGGGESMVLASVGGTSRYAPSGQLARRNTVDNNFATLQSSRLTGGGAASTNPPTFTAGGAMRSRSASKTVGYVKAADRAMSGERIYAGYIGADRLLVPQSYGGRGGAGAAVGYDRLNVTNNSAPYDDIRAELS